MRKQNTFIAYLLIGIGLFFLLKQFNIPLLNNFYSWPTLLIIVGGALLFHSYTVKEHQNILGGAIVLGIGIHFHGLENYSIWISDWAVYPLIVGIAFFLQFLQTKRGFVPSVILIGISSFFLFASQMPAWFGKVESYWPIILIVFGFLLLKKGK